MQERFDTVDKNDWIIATWFLESELHVNNDITRVVTIHIQDASWKYYIAQRSPDKKVDPLKFEAPAHGRVNSWEEYETAARRETLEELWITELKLQEIGHFYFSFDSNVWIRQHWKKLYIWKCETIWKIDPNEIYALKSFENLKTLIDYYESNIGEFSNWVKFDIPHLKNYLSKK